MPLLISDANILIEGGISAARPRVAYEAMKSASRRLPWPEVEQQLARLVDFER